MTEYIEKQRLLDFLDAAIELDEDINSRLTAIAIRGVINVMPSSEMVSAKDFRDCRNELCLKCGQYQTKHLGSCNGCRWEKR